MTSPIPPRVVAPDLPVAAREDESGVVRSSLSKPPLAQIGGERAKQATVRV
jgi:hypothetical protein